MTKFLGDYETSDEDILNVVNTVLNTDHKKLSRVPQDGLNRVLMILKISNLMANHNVSVFMCKTEDIHDAPDN